MPDLLVGPVIGGLTHKRVHLWGRASGPGVLHAWVGKHPSLTDAQLASQSLPLSPEDGFAGVAPVSGLTPDTLYYYALTLSDTPPDPTAGPYPSFTTFPLPGQPRSFAFAFGSCFRPGDQNGGQIFCHLDERRKQDSLRFILLLGDQIYADAYAFNNLGYVACSLDDYRAVYAYNWSRPPLRALLANLPAFMTIDDHEVDDDWTWTDSNRTQARIPIWDRIFRLIQHRTAPEWHIPLNRVQDALQAYWEHQGMHAPHFELPPRLNQEGQYDLAPGDPGSLAYSFTFGAAAFFVLDTRTMRVKSRRDRTMLGAGQWQALEQWLLAVKDEFPVKFLVTSCALFYDMLLDFPHDRWSGFPAERARLLHFLAANGIENLYLLAGDLHSAHAISADLYGPQGHPVPIWEFCSSPFEQQTNWLSRFTYFPLQGLPVKNQKRHFSLGLYNFGVVRVDFDSQGKPEVHFEVYGKDGDLLAQV
ncbi:MAG: alkaline phosphatase family protein [Chloroflexota bacterium]|nr:MAG: alkaline phosphatase family protein [Chloroflexota bacterium]